MAQKRRDSDLSSELYFSVYGKNRKLKPRKVKGYALYKPLLKTTATNNIVVADNETNISVSFKEGLKSRVFSFDKVFYSDIPQDDFNWMCTSAIQDVILGLNSFLVLYKLKYPVSPERKNFVGLGLRENIIQNVLKELIFFVNNEENMDCSLHVSYFEMHGDKMIDCLAKCVECRELQIHKNPKQDGIEIKGLIEKSLNDDKDIVEFTKRPHSFDCIATCCHSVTIVSLVRKNINNDGLEFLKVGKLTLVGPASCRNCLRSENTSTDDCLLNALENDSISFRSESKMLTILKPAFEEKVTTTVIVLVSSVLCGLEKDLRILQFVSEICSSMTHPEIDLQLIIRNSTKEYAEEIKELQKDLDATTKSSGIRISHLQYRSIKNSLAVEDEKIKNLEVKASGMTHSIDFKKQEIMDLLAALQSKETEINEVEKANKILQSELEERKKNNVIQKVSSKAGEIIDLKQMMISNELYSKKLKSQIIKDNRNYEELTRSIHFLKNETASLLCDIDAQSTSQKSTLELLIVDINNTLIEFQSLEKDLTAELSNFFNIDMLITTWKKYIENLISKFSSFMHKNYENCGSMELDINFTLAPRHGKTDTLLDLIKHNWSEKGHVLKYCFSKLQVFCNFSFKMLAEVVHQMNVIESCYKAEFKEISAVFGSANEAFKKFAYDINIALKSFKQHIVEQEKEFLKIMDIICFHQKFKEQCDGKINEMKQSLLDLKQMYLRYNDACFSKWNEIQKSCQKTTLKHNDLSDHLSLFRREVSRYLANLPQQKNTMEYSPMKDEADNVENRIQQLLQTHKEMKGSFGEALTVHKEGIDKECTEIENYVRWRKTEIEKYFHISSEKIKASSSSFLGELQSIHQISSSNKENLEEDLETLTSSASYFESVFNKYLSTSNSLLAKSERSFKVIPSVSESKKDNISDFENLLLEEWDVTTSTPNAPEKEDFNISMEKEKLISRVKSLAVQQMLQKHNISTLDHEEKEESKNVSTVSLPNIRTHLKASILTEKSFPRAKFYKK